MYGVPPPTLTFWILGWRALLSCGSGALFDWARGLDGVYCCHDDFFAPQHPAATALLLLPVGDGGGSYDVACAESGVSHVR